MTAIKKSAKFYGLDLPEFSPDRPLIGTKDGLRTEATRSEDHTMLRFCRTIGPSDETLSDRLKRANTYFKRLEEYAGIDIVGFQYGLYPEENRGELEALDVHMGRNIVPDGFLLAAEVQIIKAMLCEGEHSATRELRSRISAFAVSIVAEKGHLIDIGFKQTMFGMPAGHQNDEPKHYYNDIEPLSNI